MTTADGVAPGIEPIQLPGFAWLIAAVALFGAYLMLQENGAVLADSWGMLHELFHDGRHALGVPCH